MYMNLCEVREKASTIFFKDEMALKRILEDMGQAKTHMEIRKMIQEVDTTDSGAISYMEFLELMFGKKNTVLSR